MGIMSSLSSITILSVNPKKQIISAYDAQRQSYAQVYEKAFNQYFLDNNSFPAPKGGSQAIPTGTSAGAKQICSSDTTTALNCVKVEEAFAGSNKTYLSSIPRDSKEPCPDYTGYKVFSDANLRIRVFPVHLGKGLSDKVYCSSGCAPPVSSTQCLQLCGDGFLMGTEECEDGNVTNGDGCSSTCACEGPCGS